VIKHFGFTMRLVGNKLKTAISRSLSLASFPFQIVTGTVTVLSDLFVVSAIRPNLTFQDASAMLLKWTLAPTTFASSLSQQTHWSLQLIMKIAIAVTGPWVCAKLTATTMMTAKVT
jgi:hypothetical protein